MSEMHGGAKAPTAAQRIPRQAHHFPVQFASNQKQHQDHQMSVAGSPVANLNRSRKNMRQPGVAVP